MKTREKYICFIIFLLLCNLGMSVYSSPNKKESYQDSTKFYKPIGQNKVIVGDKDYGKLITIDNFFFSGTPGVGGGASITLNDKNDKYKLFFQAFDDNPSASSYSGSYQGVDDYGIPINVYANIDSNNPDVYELSSYNNKALYQLSK